MDYLAPLLLFPQATCTSERFPLPSVFQMKLLAEVD